jgi:predicted  nucleic acid-binding Zn-ribbon protein
MNSQIYCLALLSFVDNKLDELQEEYGDLPEKVKRMKSRVSELKAIAYETTSILDDLRKFTTKSKTTLVDLKAKEEKLAKQQFLVRNNKEFDAITREIETSRNEYNKIIDELRTVGMKEENLLATLEKQRADVNESEKELIESESELKEITSDQNEEVKSLIKKRNEIIKDITKENLTEYNRIRLHTYDAAVKIKRNSCSGCFSAVPAQKIVEVRNHQDQLFLCENCGRILYPEDYDVNEKVLGL